MVLQIMVVHLLVKIVTKYYVGLRFTIPTEKRLWEETDKYEVKDWGNLIFNFRV